MISVGESPWRKTERHFFAGLYSFIIVCILSNELPPMDPDYWQTIPFLLG